MLGRASKTQKKAGSDPIERQRQRLSISDTERAGLEGAVDAEVQAAVSSALGSQGERA
jgi:hypothetical protein